MYSILIADDEQWMRQSIVSMIDWEAHDFVLVGEACHGGDALAKIDAVRPDIVLADIRMPGLDGLEMLRRINRQMYRPVVIFLSGYSCFDYAQEAVNLGACGYLLKPVGAEELSEALGKAVKKIETKQKRLEYEQSDTYSEACGRLISESLKELKDILEPARREEALRFTDCLSGKIAEAQLNGREIRLLCYQLAGTVLSLVFDDDRSRELDLELLSYYEKIDQCKTTAEMLQVIRQLMMKRYHMIEQAANEGNKSVAQAVKYYIDTHYMEDVSLDTLSEVFHLHPVYLSTMFKEQLGESFISYLTTVRLQKAKELLRLGERTAAVARNVGYRDAKYFTKVFRKIEGVSPKEYRERSFYYSECSRF